MLLLHQAGSVKVGQVVRYTLTYTPSSDRILPTPQHLHLKVKNTSAIALRAAWVHGPYTLHCSAYPASFNPHQRVDDESEGVPQYEPMLKAAGSWSAKLAVPDAIRETGADLGKNTRRESAGAGRAGQDLQDDQAPGSVTWVIEVQSQILFSASASVHYEVLVGRDERSLDLGFAAVAGHGHGGPGHVQYCATEAERRKQRDRGNVQTAGVYSRAVRLVVEDTEMLWDKPPLPDAQDEKKEQDEWERERSEKGENEEKGGNESGEDGTRKKPRRRKNVHLVVLTHGMHSNIGADMLFMKESIDATVKQARIDAKLRKEKYREQQRGRKQKEANSAENGSDDGGGNVPGTAPLTGGQEELEDEEHEDEEEVIVRGFPGNAVRTENGIQYLGKRLAKYILRFTYPDQPFLPVKKNLSEKLSDTFKSEADKAKRDGNPSHAGSSVHAGHSANDLPYKFTSISFIGHSLGGLTQTYAMAYIHKHSPTFFQQIKPINFICLASPMLGLSNENPMYVKFALDFGLVGRTGQDLGLTWRPPTVVRGGWNAMIGGLGAGQKDQQEEDPSAKPLLRILPTGPAHQVLRMFRNRTLYSNVVNDGIVPLRTSCLLFLDWKGLGKVEKARRENGLIGTMAEWGWAELTGQNSSNPTETARAENNTQNRGGEITQGLAESGAGVPQPGENETAEDNRRLTTRRSVEEADTPSTSDESPSRQNTTPQQPQRGMLDNFLDFFRGAPPEPAPRTTSKKTSKALRRGQTIYRGEDEMPDDIAEGREETTTNPTMRPHMPHSHTGQVAPKRPKASRGDTGINPNTGELEAPPKTSIFESAGDILHPPLPSKLWITDPSSRSQTIFHDRIYHPEDIPPPPTKRTPSRLARTPSSSDHSPLSKPPSSAASSTHSSDSAHSTTTDNAGMKVEEKIARAYHRDLSWRKVLVRLEPDAHNNMIVRRLFANAYGWPVVKHLCDTHFADTHAAITRDEDEPARERAPPLSTRPDASGAQVAEQTAAEVQPRSQSEAREARDELKDLAVSRDGTTHSHSSLKTLLAADSRPGSAVWDDSYFEGSDEDSDDVDERTLVQRLINPMPLRRPEQAYQPPGKTATSPRSERKGGRGGGPGSPTGPGSPSGPASPGYTEGHRGLAPTSPTLSRAAPAESKKVVEGEVTGSGLVQEPELMSGTGSLGLRTGSGAGSGEEGGK